ncbi:hypothetical protein N7507_002430 [Penicillium longicatenatum]|nr:hypothetical protein N7507_002430 [Penicillium longicatenatum]
MRSQQLLALCGLMLAGPLAIAAKLEHDDVPNRCWAACGPVVGISESCDSQHDNDFAELQCICNWAPAKTQIPLCAACITQYGDGDNDNYHDHDDDHDDDDDDDNDALDIVYSCSFSTTTYNAAAATTLSASTTSTGTAASAAASAATTTDSAVSGGSSQGSTTTDTAVSRGSSQGSSTTASGGSASSPTATTDAAAGISAPGVIYMAGLMGMLPLAWL